METWKMEVLQIHYLQCFQRNYSCTRQTAPLLLNGLIKQVQKVRTSSKSKIKQKSGQIKGLCRGQPDALHHPALAKHPDPTVL